MILQRVSLEIQKKLDDLTGSLLLGLSGGVDSIALFALLHPLCQQNGVPLIALHIDHGWRPESSEQALKLQQWVKNQGGECIVQKVLPCKDGNAENKAREQRLWRQSEQQRASPSNLRR